LCPASLILLMLAFPASAAWFPDANPVGSLPGFKQLWAMIPGASDDLYLAWDGSGLRLQRFLGSGEVAPGWPIEGLLISEDGADSHPAALGLDTEGGVIVTWLDHRHPGGQNFSDIYAKHILPDGTLAPDWPVGGLPICRYPTQEYALSVLRDDDGGFFIGWHDTRPLGGYPSGDAYLTRILRNGTLDPAWPVNGSSIGQIDTYEGPVLAPDGMRGLFVARPLREGQIRVHRIGINGTPLPGWPAEGISTAATVGIRPKIVPDGTGGCFVAWMDGRFFLANRWDIRAVRLRNDGTLAAGWLQGGKIVGFTSGEQYDPDLLPDGEGGAYFAWSSQACTNCGYWPGRATRLDESGQPVPGWTINGTPLQADLSGHSSLCRALPDGKGGLIVASVNNFVHAQHFDPVGTYAANWPPEGKFIYVSGRSPDGRTVYAPDGRGGFYAAWRAIQTTILLQRVTTDGRVCGTENRPPTQTPPSSGSEITVTVGEPFELSWRFQDPNGLRDDLVVETLSPVPGFLEVTPSLPATGPEVVLTVAGTPGVADAGRYTLTFRARDRCDAAVTGTATLIVNRAPECGSATAIASKPNADGFRNVSLAGIVDPDGDAVDVEVTGIRQDEDPLSPSSGRSCPDARITAGQVSVRDERNGNGDGRVYHLSFTATDGHGGSCQGSASVCIPHDRGANSRCVDGGALFVSTTCDASQNPGLPNRNGAGGGLRLGSAGNLRLSLDGIDSGPASFELCDVTGRAVARWQYSLSAGATQLDLSVGALPMGLYFLRMHAPGGSTHVWRYLHTTR
ncbi:MAG TPA: hypothetical protein VF720_15415, partial [Candidatus Eisenbacteria bacterium]